MEVKIRLRRMGQKKAPYYRIVVADSRSPRDGRCIEEIGTYDPNNDPSTFTVNEEEGYIKIAYTSSENISGNITLRRSDSKGNFLNW